MADLATLTNAGIGLGGFLLGIGIRYGTAKASYKSLRDEVAVLSAAMKGAASAADVKVLAEEVEDLDDLKRQVADHDKVLFKPDRSLNIITAEACDKSTAEYRQRICTKLDEIKLSQSTNLAPVNKQLEKIFEWMTAWGELVGAMKAHMDEHKKGG